MTEAFWHDILATNLQGPFRCTRAASDGTASLKTNNLHERLRRRESAE